MAEFLIAPGALGDLDALVALEQDAFSSDRLDRRQLRHALRSPRLTLLVARHGSALAGYALLHRRRGVRSARLTSLAVADDAKGRGLGRALLAAIEAAARQDGYETLRLEVRPRNATARKIYEAAGFVRFASVPAYYEDGGTAWRYEKRL